MQHDNVSDPLLPYRQAISFFEMAEKIVTIAIENIIISNNSHNFQINTDDYADAKNIKCAIVFLAEVEKNKNHLIEKLKTYEKNVECVKIEEFYVDIMRQYIERFYQGWSTSEGWTIQKELAVVERNKKKYKAYEQFLL